MAGKSKIEKYSLEARVSALAFNDGKNTREIAEILTDELAGKDTISQSAVSNYVKPLREESRAETRQTINQHIKEKLDSDLESVEEVQLFLLNEMRDTDSNPSVTLRADLGVKAIRVIDTKMRWGLGDARGSRDGIDPVDLEEFKNEVEDLKKEAEDG